MGRNKTKGHETGQGMTGQGRKNEQDWLRQDKIVRVGTRKNEARLDGTLQNNMKHARNGQNIFGCKRT